MNRSLALVTVLLATLALAGCAPDTKQAYENCFDALSLEATLDDTLSVEEATDIMVEAAEICSKSAELDPAAFNEKWAD